ncbi:hypothetical protein [Dialister sp.]|jgi:hypothetical protein|uniref:hypothetical protein n=1 Tax=Dialister sp. TaxID=1955814 RepID=UPI0025E33114|nr:hypothetical protein [Dialister sp.]
MSMTWVYITLLLLLGGFVLQMMPLLIYFPAVLIVNLLIFGIGTYLIRRDGRVENRQNILFLAGLTVINILTALDILSYYMSWAAFLALLVWSFFGGGRGK